MISVLLDFLDEALHLASLGEVGGDGDGFARDGEGIEGIDSFGAGGGFAGGNEDFGAAGLEETGGALLVEGGVERGV